ncbi:MAG: hypothetical protein RLZZ352_1032 [Pseudomonadota bacterium]
MITQPTPGLVCDVFCRVVDNLGDIGVCWRLCANLVARGHRVRLWIDEPEALRWMAPGALEGQWAGIAVLHWTQALSAEHLHTSHTLPADVWLETFGCQPPAELQHQLAGHLAGGGVAPVWVNLEYLSAERYVERSHRLPSLASHGPLRGMRHWFFYPGFTRGTGGLLREPGLMERRQAFDALSWLAQQGWVCKQGRRISLFCYEPPALPALLRQACADGGCDWLVTAGRASAAVQAAQTCAAAPTTADDGGCTPVPPVQYLPLLTQQDFDHLLWACDLNFVRGEDSLVRALWAGQPFVWQIYPQHDEAHHTKLEAFLDWLQAPASLRELHRVWNGMQHSTQPWPGWAEVLSWRDCVQAARERLLAQPDLVRQLCEFVTDQR